MEHVQLESLPPRAQEKYLNILLGKLQPAVRQATLDVAQWLATERPGDEHVTRPRSCAGSPRSGSATRSAASWPALPSCHSGESNERI